MRVVERKFCVPHSRQVYLSRRFDETKEKEKRREETKRRQFGFSFHSISRSSLLLSFPSFCLLFLNCLAFGERKTVIFISNLFPSLSFLLSFHFLSFCLSTSAFLSFSITTHISFSLFPCLCVFLLVATDFFLPSLLNRLFIFHSIFLLFRESSLVSPSFSFAHTPFLLALDKLFDSILPLPFNSGKLLFPLTFSFLFVCLSYFTFFHVALKSVTRTKG